MGSSNTATAHIPEASERLAPRIGRPSTVPQCLSPALLILSTEAGSAACPPAALGRVKEQRQGASCTTHDWSATLGPSPQRSLQLPDAETESREGLGRRATNGWSWGLTLGSAGSVCEQRGPAPPSPQEPQANHGPLRRASSPAVRTETDPEVVGVKGQWGCLALTGKAAAFTAVMAAGP